ncbi:hypothetical protein BHE74_00020584 [Ensete ventricosum]|nr:hypothetical protein BHE74_00020584 [Ensete ventricosum]
MHAGEESLQPLPSSSSLYMLRLQWDDDGIPLSLAVNHPLAVPQKENFLRCVALYDLVWPLSAMHGWRRREDCSCLLPRATASLRRCLAADAVPAAAAAAAVGAEGRSRHPFTVMRLESVCVCLCKMFPDLGGERGATAAGITDLGVAAQKGSSVISLL